MSALYQTNLFERLSFGSVPGCSQFVLTGYNGAVTTTNETVWDESTVYALRTNVAAMTVSSSDVNDTSAGTGARTVSVTGIRSDLTQVSETATMNGTTGVALSTQFLQINSVTVLTAGSGGSNAGIIYVGTGTVTAGKPAIVDGLIAAGRNGSTSAIYMVPANYSLALTNIRAQTQSTTAGGLQITLESKENFGLVMIPFLHGFANTDQMDITFKQPLKFNEKTQLQVKVLSNAGTGPVTVRLDGFLTTSGSLTPNTNTPF